MNFCTVSPGDSGGGWFLEEKRTTIEAFASFTIDAAYSAHQENLSGTLEAGKKADFIVAARDIFPGLRVKFGRSSSCLNKHGLTGKLLLISLQQNYSGMFPG